MMNNSLISFVLTFLLIICVRSKKPRRLLSDDSNDSLPMTSKEVKDCIHSLAEVTRLPHTFDKIHQISDYQYERCLYCVKRLDSENYKLPDEQSKQQWIKYLNSLKGIYTHITAPQYQHTPSADSDDDDLPLGIGDRPRLIQHLSNLFNLPYIIPGNSDLYYKIVHKLEDKDLIKEFGLTKKEFKEFIRALESVWLTKYHRPLPHEIIDEEKEWKKLWWFQKFERKHPKLARKIAHGINQIAFAVANGESLMSDSYMDDPSSYKQNEYNDYGISNDQYGYDDHSYKAFNIKGIDHPTGDFLDGL